MVSCYFVAGLLRTKTLSQDGLLSRLDACCTDDASGGGYASQQRLYIWRYFLFVLSGPQDGQSVVHPSGCLAGI